MSSFIAIHAPSNLHLADEPVLVDRPALLAVGYRRLRPHLLDILQNHVAVPVKGLDAGQQLAVRADADEDLGVRADGGLQNGQRAVAKLPLLELCDLVFPIVVSILTKLYQESGIGVYVRALVPRLLEEFSVKERKKDGQLLQHIPRGRARFPGTSEGLCKHTGC